MRQKFQPPRERALQGDPWGGHLLLHHLDNDDDGDDDDAKDDGNSEDNGDDDEDDDDHEDDRDDDRTKSSSPHKIRFLVHETLVWGWSTPCGRCQCKKKKEAYHLFLKYDAPLEIA